VRQRPTSDACTRPASSGARLVLLCFTGMWGQNGPPARSRGVKRSSREKPRKGASSQAAEGERASTRRGHHERSQVLPRMVKTDEIFGIRVQCLLFGIGIVVLWLIFSLSLLCFRRSNNMLYPREDKETRTLLYACQSCEHEVDPLFVLRFIHSFSRFCY
jgi:hypothetical protein